MTKREAVEILRHADTDSEVDTDDYLKAFDMAVNALERESEIDELRQKVLEMYGLNDVPKEVRQAWEKLATVQKKRNPALDVKPNKLPIEESPRHTLLEASRLMAEEANKATIPSHEFAKRLKAFAFRS